MNDYFTSRRRAKKNKGLSRSIYAYWKLNNDFLDSSGNNLTLTQYSGTGSGFTTDRCSNPTGAYKNLSVEASNAGLKVLNQTRPNNAVSASLWINLTDLDSSGNAWLLSHRTGSSTARNWQVFYNNGALSARFWNADMSLQLNLTYTIDISNLLNTWNNVIVTTTGLSGDVARLYLNNVEVASGTLTFNVGNISAPFSLCSINPDTQSSTEIIGDIDDVIMFDKKLTIAEINYIYNKTCNSWL